MKSVRGLCGALVMSLTVLTACNQEEQTQVKSEVNERTQRRSQLQQQLTGTWVRRVRTADTLLEGLRLDSDGRFGLFGIHTLHGLQWLVRGDTLVLTTSTENYAQPQESRLWVRRVDEDSLVLSAETGYLAGSYGRGVDLAQRVTGIVKGALPEEAKQAGEAAMYLELRAITGESGSKYLASQSLPVNLLHSSIPFHVYYASQDAQGCDEGRLIVSLAIDGVPRRVLDWGPSVDLRADAENLEIWLSLGE